MQASEREQFKAELTKLCAGFDVPITKAREEAYWTGLTRMSLLQFRRVVERALGEGADLEKFPTVGTVWKLHRGTQAALPQAQQPIEPDGLKYLANRLLWLHVSHRGGFGSVGDKPSHELDRCLQFKAEIVAEFENYILEDDECANLANFVSFWMAGLAARSEVLPRTKLNYEQLVNEPNARQPFPRSMVATS